MLRSGDVHYLEIDGLRAIAISCIVLFHLGSSGFYGGFIGVDVFFVISGYLISWGILKRVDEGGFKLMTFYLRRIRRLFPPLIVVMGASFIFSVYLLSPNHLISFAGSVISSIFFVSNIFFYNESGYFEISAQFRPLLHIWALSVEEQFYLLWPLILILLLKIRDKKAQFASLILLALSSLFLSEYFTHVDIDAAYFLTPFRAFDFILGASCVWIHQRPISNRLREAGLVLGLGLMAYSVNAFDRYMPYPGFYSLLPCIGAVLIILSKDAVYTGKILRNRLLTHLGKISYSLYLVHWPIIVFYNRLFIAKGTLPEMLFLSALSLFCAEILFRLVENPFSKRTQMPSFEPKNGYLLPIGLASIVLILLSLSVIYGGGWVWRFEDKSLEEWDKDTGYCDTYNERERFPYGITIGSRKDGEADILLLGDSHASGLMCGLGYLGKKHDLKIDVWTFMGCPPIWGTYRIYRGNADVTQTCKELIPQWRAYVEKMSYKHVILANRWMYLYEHDDYGDFGDSGNFLVDYDDPVKDTQISRNLFRERLGKTVEEIQESGSNVLVFSQMPLLRRNIEFCDEFYSFNISDIEFNQLCDPGIEYEKIMDRLRYTDETIRELSSPNVLSVIPSDHFCNDELRMCRTAFDLNLLYKDDNHLSNIGSLILIKLIEDNLTEFINSNKEIRPTKYLY